MQTHLRSVAFLHFWEMLEWFFRGFFTKKIEKQTKCLKFHLFFSGVVFRSFRAGQLPAKPLQNPALHLPPWALEMAEQLKSFYRFLFQQSTS